MPSATAYSLDARLPEVLIRGRATVVRARLMRAGAMVVPSAAVLTVTRDDGTAAVDGETATIAGSGEVSYTVPASTVPVTYTPSNLWQVRWTLTVDGVAEDYVLDCTLARYWPSVRVTEGQMNQRHQGLSELVATGQTLQQFIDAAWDRVVRKLIGVGRAPHKILNSGALFEYHLALTLSMLYTDAATSLGTGRYAELAEQYAERARVEWRDLRLTIDEDDSGTADQSETGQGASGILMTGGRPIYGWRQRL